MTEPAIPLLRTSPSLVDIAYEATVEAIISGRFPPGQRVTIDQMAREMNMSITPVREALTRAAADGLLKQSRNRGFMVSELLTHQTYHQMFAVRKLIETHAALYAYPTAEDLLTLEQLNAEMEALEPSADYQMYRTFNQLDQAFHRRIVTLARNPFLTTAWDGLHFHLQMSRLYAEQGVIDHDWAAAEHAEILSALQQDKLQTASDAVSGHILGAEQRLSGLLPED
jgi:DNA-binding GntR family transcriptional regulator